MRPFATRRYFVILGLTASFATATSALSACDSPHSDTGGPFVPRGCEDTAPTTTTATRAFYAADASGDGEVACPEPDTSGVITVTAAYSADASDTSESPGASE